MVVTSRGFVRFVRRAESYDEAKAAALWDQSAELVGLGSDGIFRLPGSAIPT